MVLWNLNYLGFVERIRLVEPLLNHCQINRILDYIQIVRNLNPKPQYVSTST